MAQVIKQVIKNKFESHAEMVFPVSSRSQVRHLVLRNPTADHLMVKLRTNNEDLLHIPSSDVVVRAYEWLAIPCKLHVDGLKEIAELQFVSLRIFCRRYCAKKPNLHWLKDDSDNARFLVRSLNVTRVRGFAAPDTVVDLPGASALIETPPFATVDMVDDSDCRTAHHVDSDTTTARAIEPGHWAAIAADSCISTAHRIDEGMKTANDIDHPGAACWLNDSLKRLYPSGGQKKLDSKQGGYGTIFPCGASD